MLKETEETIYFLSLVAFQFRWAAPLIVPVVGSTLKLGVVDLVPSKLTFCCAGEDTLLFFALRLALFCDN